MTVPQRPAAILTKPFMVVTTAGLILFTGFGATIALLPQFVKDELGKGDAAVGIVFGSISFSAIAVRPIAGRLGEQYGRRILMVGGGLVTGVAIALHGLAPNITVLILFRLLVGAGEGAFFVGMATLVSDLAPPARRGEAISYFSVAVYLGLGIGPTFGEAVLDATDFGLAWLAAGLVCVVGAFVSLFAPARVAPVEDPGGHTMTTRGVAIRSLLHPSAVPPGIVMALGLIGYASFQAYVPIHVDSVGLDDSRFVFLVYSGVVMLVRLVGARVPDVLGARIAGTVAILAVSSSLLVLFAWRQPAGVFTATVGIAIGMSLLYPSLLTAAVNDAPDHERALVVASFTMFFDVSVGFGGLILGIVAGLTSPQGAFLAGAIICLTALPVLLTAVRVNRVVVPA